MKSTLANRPLAELLDQHVAPASPQLWRSEDDRIRCLACGHRCLIGPRQRGICKVRFEQDGQLKVPFGYVAGVQSDPVEKKPFFHVYPGSDALTFGMMGCDLHCSYCQNWLTSQALRDVNAVAPIRAVTPSDLVAIGKREGARLVVSSYNEPLITAEWAVAVFKEARSAGLACGFVSNGNATPEVLDFLKPWIVAYKVDLKCFNDRNYRKLGGMLENITSTIRMIHERGIWLEVVTLVVPGFNDSATEIRDIAKFLASVSRDIPWHITAFHKDYRMTDPDPTSDAALTQAAGIGAEEGLRFVYAGNLPGRVGPWENTRCPSCQTAVIERTGYLIRSYSLTAEGCCPKCQTKLPGVWPKGGVKVQGSGVRMPRPLAMAATPQLPPSQLHDRRQGSPVVKDFRSPREQPIMSVKQASHGALQSQRPTISLAQKNRLIASVGGILRSLVQGGPAAFSEDMVDIANLQIWGSFVSLKRGKHLRSCSGALGRTMPLQQAVCLAAERTVWEDERFPPVSASELHHLDVEVWLLFDPQPVMAKGAKRVEEISLGKHGIQVARGDAGALFLPSVAPENDWDVHTFLDRVCMKAGLPASAWREDDTDLFTFEGDVIHSPLSSLLNGEPALVAAPFREEELTLLTDLCRANLNAMLIGAAPRYFAGAPDGMLNGVVLSIQPPGSEGRAFTRFSMRPGLPLHSTLFSLVQMAAQSLNGQSITQQDFDNTNLNLMLLHDPMLHGTVADPHLAGFEPNKRAFLVLERNKAGLVYDSALDAKGLLDAAAKEAHVGQPATSGVYSLGAVTNAQRIVVSTAPRPVRGPAVRPAAMAGRFYDADPARLMRMVDEFLRLEESAAPLKSCSAAMIPHAALQFSGRIAGDVLKRIKIPETVIVIGPSHTGMGMEWAVAPHQTWALPGAEIASDFILARKLCQAIPGLEMDAAAHQQEHAIEVELPIIARLSPQSKIVGITIAHGDLESCRRFAKGLAEVIRDRQESTLLLVSSDMNHFARDAENRRLDAMAIEAMERGDPAELLQTVQRNNISMCGVLPAVIVMETLKLLKKPTGATKISYATSADVTGDKSRVVGYAGMLLG